MDQAYSPEIERLRRYHTERREQKVTVTFEKSPLPMLWLDTSVLIDLAKIDKREAIDPGRVARLTKLRSTVQRLTLDRKLICPECDQDNEFEGKRLEDEINAIVLMLALGARCQPYQGVKDAQIWLGTLAYRAMTGTVHVPWTTCFYGDPREAVAETLNLGVVIDPGLKKPKDWIDRSDCNKSTLQASWERLRQDFNAQKRNFDEQLKLEKLGESDSMISMICAYNRRVGNGTADMWDHLGVEGFHVWMRSWGGSFEEAISALYSFMRSNYYGELPIVDVACRLGADLVVNPPPVKSGDGMDIQHMATVIPVAQYVVVDRAMADRCERMKLPEKYRTKVYSSRTLDDLIAELEAL
jgi:hypothetical protein